MLLGGFSIFSSIVSTAFAGELWSAGDRKAQRVLGAEQCFGLRVYIGLPSILLRSCVISRGVASGFFSRNSSTPSASSYDVIPSTNVSCCSSVMPCFIAARKSLPFISISSSISLLLPLLHNYLIDIGVRTHVGYFYTSV